MMHVTLTMAAASIKSCVTTTISWKSAHNKISLAKNFKRALWCQAHAIPRETSITFRDNSVRQWWAITEHTSFTVYLSEQRGRLSSDLSCGGRDEKLTKVARERALKMIERFPLAFHDAPRSRVAAGVFLRAQPQL